jgi:xylulokinase
MATSGTLTAWLRDLAGEPAWDVLLAEVAAVPPGARGLLVLPHFAGERTPILDPRARGVVAGLTLRHGRPELARAVYEATAYGVRHNLEAMREAGGAARRLVAVGGGTRGGLWTQIVSDVLRRPQVLPSITIGACYGDALLAGVATGVDVDPQRWNPVAEEIRPDPDRAARYDAYYGHYRELYRATSGIAHFLAEEQRTAG